MNDQPHKTRMTPFGLYCDTEQQGYCNYEAPEDEEGPVKNLPLTETQAAHLKEVLEVNLDDIADGIWIPKNQTKDELTADVNDMLKKLEGTA